MSIAPDDHLADDDLDTTAKLPILSFAEADDEATGEYRMPLGATAESREVGGPWDLSNELVSVRDRIGSLEAALADTEIKLAELQASYDSLQSHHADLVVHSQAVSRDRDRLAEEALISVAGRQQLQDQLEEQRVETNTARLKLQQSLEHQQRSEGELQRQLTERCTEADRLRELHARQISDVARQLEEQRQHGEARHWELLAAQQQFAQQHASAAALARSMAQALVEKDDLQCSLQAREQRIAALEDRVSDTDAQLASASATGDLLAQTVATHQREISERGRQGSELRSELTLASERIAQLVSQVEAERSHRHSAEQGKERLCQAVATERETLENVRRELSDRQATITALQDGLNRVAVEKDQLGQQLAERDATLSAREEAITNQHRELLALQESQTALSQRHESDARALDTERESRQQLGIEVGVLREQLGQLQLQVRERDKLALEQANALDEVNSTNHELTDHIRHRDQTLVAQSERIANLSAAVQGLQDEGAHQNVRLQETRRELATKHLELGASARQVESLQLELHQHVEAMQAIRREIHQVAAQTHTRDGETLVRTLARDDAEGVVHLLNKSSISIGREDDCDIALPSSSVSRYHAVLKISHDAVIFEDMNSTNGSFVNGRRIKRRLLKDGDRLKVGSVPLRFAIRATQD